ncbi:MAG: glycerophosphoryl diester phosphodiesterase [Planctomycetes bacterium]|nr:glycerophosphoryl diester phosphodiesterase [Planctomycetota bacterium]
MHAHPRPLLIGHRGAPRVRPENTLGALAAAADLGLTWVEIDVRLTRDGGLVLVHDDTLERTTSGSGRVRDLDLARVVALSADRREGGRFPEEHVPTLDACLGLVRARGLHIDVEIKTDDEDARESAEAVVACITRHFAAPDGAVPWVSSDCAAALARVRELAPSLPRALVVERADVSAARTCAALGCAALVCDQALLDASVVDAWRAASPDVPLWVYTVNDGATALRLADLGCAAFFTDDAPALRAALAGRSAPPPG